MRNWWEWNFYKEVILLSKKALSKKEKKRLKKAKRFANGVPSGKFLDLDYDPTGETGFGIRYISYKNMRSRLDKTAPEELWIMLEGIEEVTGLQVFLGVDLCYDSAIGPFSNELIFEAAEGDDGEFFNSVTTPIGTFGLLSFEVENGRLVWRDIPLTDAAKEILSLNSCACGVDKNGIVYAGMVSSNRRIRFPLYPPEHYTPGTEIHKLAVEYRQMCEDGRLIRREYSMYEHLQSCIELGNSPTAVIQDAETGESEELTGQEAFDFIKQYIEASGEDCILREYVVRPEQAKKKSPKKRSS